MEEEEKTDIKLEKGAKIEYYEEPVMTDKELAKYLEEEEAKGNEGKYMSPPEFKIWDSPDPETEAKLKK